MYDLLVVKFDPKVRCTLIYNFRTRVIHSKMKAVGLSDINFIKIGVLWENLRIDEVQGSLNFLLKKWSGVAICREYTPIQFGKVYVLTRTRHSRSCRTFLRLPRTLDCICRNTCKTFCKLRNALQRPVWKKETVLV